MLSYVTNELGLTLFPQTMDRRLSLLLLVAAVAGLLVLGLAPPTSAEDDLDQLDPDDGLDVEDELDLGLVDEEDGEGGDTPEEEVAKAAPPAPKVGGWAVRVQRVVELVPMTCVYLC